MSDKFDLDTQRVRFELILQLKALAEMTQEKAIDTIQPETKQNWARLSAYISQVINSISKTFDETSTDTELKELEKKIAELFKMKEDKSAPQT